MRATQTIRARLGLTANCLLFAALAWQATVAGAQPKINDNKINVPAGDYRPFFKRADGAREIPVASFALDVIPVSKAQFRDFVIAHPEWRKSRVIALWAERTYLADWVDDLDPGEDLDAPVTFVSWFAARAYCSEHGRLPTVAEWERVAGASATAANSAAPFQFAMGRLAGDVRQSPLRFGAVWEWTEDFNSTPAFTREDDARGSAPLFCGDGYRSNNANDYAAFLRYSLRSSLRANYSLKNLGFRCAR